jgi:hypothetical protein
VQEQEQALRDLRRELEDTLHCVLSSRERATETRRERTNTGDVQILGIEEPLRGETAGDVNVEICIEKRHTVLQIDGYPATGGAETNETNVAHRTREM